MKSPRITTFSIATILSAVGCGGPDPSPSPGASSGASTAGTSPSGTSTSGATTTPPPPPLTIRGFAHGADASVLAGVEVCLYGKVAAAIHPPDTVMCTVSAADGSFGVSGAGANTDVMLTFKKDGFAPMLRAIATQTDDIMLPASENALLPDPLVLMGKTADPSKGQISFFVATSDGQNATEASVKLIRFEDTYSQPPVYLDRGGAVAAGAATGSRGWFVDVPAGLYSLRFGGALVTCAATTALYGYPVTAFGDPSSGEGIVLVPVVEGYVTAPVGVSCAGRPS
jgi:hypothetical protein